MRSIVMPGYANDETCLQSWHQKSHTERRFPRRWGRDLAAPGTWQINDVDDEACSYACSHLPCDSFCSFSSFCVFCLFCANCDLLDVTPLLLSS